MHMSDNFEPMEQKVVQTPFLNPYCPLPRVYLETQLIMSLHNLTYSNTPTSKQDAKLTSNKSIVDPWLL